LKVDAERVDFLAFFFEDVVWCGDVRPRGAGGPSAPEKKARVATDPVDASRLLEHPGGPKRFGSRLSR
jgi:hypothetical protein